ncbi:lipocalin-like domain-containing protein [Streptomyces acidicola]|uniref:lipocalin-like domain-containing protein n=1 Tax=Streptomyces acidicola TaxID=2596892 RepID=UPI0037F42EBC
MNNPHPTMVDASGELAAKDPEMLDSWWFAARLHDDETTFWVKIHATGLHGSCISTVALLRELDGHSSVRHVPEAIHEVALSATSFDVKTSVLAMSGDLDAMEISGDTDTASIRLSLRREDPVLYNGGAGIFPFFDGMTVQYSLPGLTTSGTITVDGVTREVSGRTWFDRQWAAAGSGPQAFTWLGLDLGAGRYLSVWDTVGDGTSWLTALKPDGTHTITRAQRTGGDGHWTLAIPDLDASLEITYRGLPGAGGPLYTGVCSVTGTLEGHDITGHGYTDSAGRTWERPVVHQLIPR